MTDLFNRERDFPLNIVDREHTLFSDDFRDWIPNNLHVFSAFVEQARYVRRTMRREHYSARTIGEWLRHNSAVCEGSKGWKLNNNYFPALARLAMTGYPEDLSGLFETREKQ